MNKELLLRRPLSFFLGWRYTRAKSKSHFVSFISLSSMLGIGLGVAVLITVLSVMNGFDVEIHQRFFSMAPSITINARDEGLADWKTLANQLKTNPEVVAVAPFIGTQGMMSYEGQVQPLVITGVDFQYEEAFSALKDKMLVGKIEGSDPFSIYVGQNLAETLGLFVGSKVTEMLPKATPTPVGVIPRFKRFTVAGIFSAGHGFNFDSKLAFIDIRDAQALLQMGDFVSGVKLKIKNVYRAPILAQDYANVLPPNLLVGDWTLTYGPFFQAIKMEKTMMFFILLLIIAVAAFNLVSSLVMVVTDKQSEIAILRTLGVTPRSIMFIFMIQGMILGIGGTLFGVIFGLILTLNATHIVDFLQTTLGVQWLSSNIYFVDHLPVHINPADIGKVVGMALGLSWLATLYPSWRASKIIITEALHHE